MQQNQLHTSHPASHPVLLSDSQAGQTVRIASVMAGEGLERRLTEMGLSRGTEIQVVGRVGRKGAIIVSAFEDRMVIGHGMATRIVVAPQTAR